MNPPVTIDAVKIIDGAVFAVRVDFFFFICYKLIISDVFLLEVNCAYRDNLPLFFFWLFPFLGFRVITIWHLFIDFRSVLISLKKTTSPAAAAVWV